MIEFVSGDFFDYEADIRVNTVNCVGVMGTGVALIFKKKFPDMFNAYQQACKRNEVKPGKPHVWTHINLLSQSIIINFPTKVHWKNPSKYEYIEDGLIWLKSFLENKPESTVTLPALGCGHGGLDWNIVKGMIVEHLKDLNTKILVFEPSSSTKNSDNSSFENDLRERNIFKLLPSDKNFPHNLVGRSSVQLYCKGNVELLNKKSISLITNFKPSVREKQALLKVIDELPTDQFVIVLGLGNSYEINLAKEILSRGFSVIFVTPVGILNLKVRDDLNSLWDYDKIAILSTVVPNQIWKRHESINALKLRMKLSKVLLINTMDLEFIIRYIKNPDLLTIKIFYLNYWNSDIDFMKDLSAQKIGLLKTTMKPNVLPLIESLNKY